MDKEEKGKKPTEQDELQKIMQNFDQNPLNLTDQANQKEQDENDPEIAAKIQQQYEKFMAEMNSGGMEGLEGDEGLKGLTQALGELLGGLGENFGMDPSKAGSEFKDILQGKGSPQSFQNVAEKLLNGLMKKQLLYVPLIECKKNYDDFFANDHGKTDEQNFNRFKQQYDIINEIISTLDNTPDDKAKLISLFEKMQDYGQPPEGVSSIQMPGF